MSDNKDFFDNELIFEDEIDFDGLEDNKQEEFIEETSTEEEISKELEIIADETEEVSAEEVSEQPETSSEPISDIESEPENEPFYLSEEACDDEQNDFFEQSDVEGCEDEKKQLNINRFCIISTAISTVTLCAVAAGIAFGYNYISSVEKDLEIKASEIESLEKKNEILEQDYLEAISLIEDPIAESDEAELVETDRGKITFYDSSVGYSWTPVLAGVEQNKYKNENFVLDNRGRLSYIEDGEDSSYFGIDVSSYQGDIDWQLVKEDSVEFAFLRIGYRGYGEEGKICADEKFADNYAAAHDAGIDLGVYFFSQAVTVDEAIEEANYVLSLLEGRTLEYPIVFDWETVQTGDPEDIPRTEDVMPHTLTLSAIAFCETVRDAGYDAMIYTNKKLATIKYDLRQLRDYPIWLAYYDTALNYQYDFDIWQYGTGLVDGIEGEVDVNIAMIK